MSQHPGRSKSGAVAISVLLGLGAAAGACAPLTAASAAETAVAPEKNPPGDIPDDQVFITYASPLGFSIQVPEGWARTDKPDGVDFADKYGRVEVAITSGTAPAAASAHSGEVTALEKSGRAVKIGSVADVKLPAGAAIRIVYTSNSDPNPVTNKQIRLENERTLLGHDGKVAAVTLSAPAGADNADQWKLMNDSFRWQ
jgi:hypothetical protein